MDRTGRWHVARPRAAVVAAAAFAAVLLAVEVVIVAESWRGLVGFAGYIRRPLFEVGAMLDVSETTLALARRSGGLPPPPD